MVRTYSYIQEYSVLDVFFWNGTAFLLMHVHWIGFDLALVAEITSCTSNS